MAKTGKTQFLGTVVEVRKQGDTVWNKFVCNTGAINIDYGTYDVTESDACLETGEKEKVFGGLTYEDQTFDYAWTQAATNAGDTTMKEAHASKGTDVVEFRLTANNKTGAEASGTTYIIPIKVNAYKHMGENGGIMKTEVSIIQTGVPVEAPAA